MGKSFAGPSALADPARQPLQAAPSMVSNGSKLQEGQRWEAEALFGQREHLRGTRSDQAPTHTHRNEPHANRVSQTRRVRPATGYFRAGGFVPTTGISAAMFRSMNNAIW